MTVEQYIYELINPVLDCYPVRVDDGALKLPYCTYQIISSTPLVTTGASVSDRVWGRTRYRVQINIFAQSMIALTSSADAVRNVLHGQIDEYSGTYSVLSNEFDNEVENKGRNNPSFSRICEYEIFYNKE